MIVNASRDIHTASTGILQSVAFQEADSPIFSDEDTDMVEIDVKALGFSYEVSLELRFPTVVADLVIECGWTPRQKSIRHL